MRCLKCQKIRDQWGEDHKSIILPSGYFKQQHFWIIPGSRTHCKTGKPICVILKEFTTELGFAAFAASEYIFPFHFVCMPVVILGCSRQQIPNRKNKSSKSCSCLEFCWQFCEYFLKHQQNNIFGLFLFYFKTHWMQWVGHGELSSAPCCHHWFLWYKPRCSFEIFISKPPLCLCSPEGTCGAVGHRAFQTPPFPPFPKHSQHKHGSQRHPGGGKMRFFSSLTVGLVSSVEVAPWGPAQTSHF